VGGAANPLDWYRRVVTKSVRGLSVPLLIVSGLVISGLILGATSVAQYPFLIPADKLQDAGKSLEQLSALLPVFQVGSVAMIWWQNVRVLLISMLLGIFTFGVLGVLPLMATMAISGYLAGLLSASGVAILPIVGLFLPHGILEVPAAVLATAAVLRAGAILATPTPGRTIGEVWLANLADWLKVMLGIVMPVLVLAACIEVLVTPQIAILVLGR
jgi:uncharacterized membrane protein SpoIIM required for sporulation